MAHRGYTMPSNHNICTSLGVACTAVVARHWGYQWQYLNSWFNSGCKGMYELQQTMPPILWGNDNPAYIEMAVVRGRVTGLLEQNGLD